jgi:hypothetical protein
MNDSEIIGTQKLREESTPSRIIKKITYKEKEHKLQWISQEQ